MAQQTYYIPDLLRDWPWQRSMHSHYQAGKEESQKWLESFKPFTPKGQAAFNNCDFSLLCALTYPECSLYDFRSCCALMNAFFVLDEHTDVADTLAAQSFCDAAQDAVMHPETPRPDGEHVVGEIVRQFWLRASNSITPVTRERFEASWCAYVDSVAEQASRRELNYICSLDEYLIARRQNIGTRPSFAFIEVCLALDIPHEVMEHPAIASLVRDASDMIIIGNDVASYRKEFLAGDAGYNIITVVMSANETGLDGALKIISAMHDELLSNFTATMNDVLQHKNGIPLWGERIDKHIALYIDGLGRWVRGSDQWNFESARYFGTEGRSIQKSRVVTIS